MRVEIEYFIALCELPLPQLAGFDKLKLNFEDYSLSARLTDNVINSSPLLYMRNKEEIHQICPMNLLLGAYFVDFSM